MRLRWLGRWLLGIPPPSRRGVAVELRRADVYPPRWMPGFVQFDDDWPTGLFWLQESIRDRR
jgi:hypothetical protein